MRVARRRRLIIGGVDDCTAMLGDGLLAPPQVRNCGRVVQAGHRVLWIDLQRSHEHRTRFVIALLTDERDAQHDEGVHVFWLLGEAPLEMRDPVLGTPCVDERHPQVDVRSRAVRAQRERGLEVVDGGVVVVVVVEPYPEVRVAHRARRLRLDCVCPQRPGVAPDLNLMPAQDSEGRNERNDRAGGGVDERRPRSTAVRQQPAEARADEQREPERREVRITVACHLIARVCDAGDRSQHDEVRRPRGQDRRTPTSQDDGDHRHRKHREPRGTEPDVEETNVDREFVHGAEADRKHGLPDVEQRGRADDGDAGRQRISVERREVMVRLLSVVSEAGSDETEHRVRHLFEKDRSVRRPASRLEPEASQRVYVQDDEQRGKRHDHRFRRESDGEREDRQHDQPSPRWRLIVRAQIQQHAREEEHHREHIATLSDPRDGFSAQRMKAEEERGRRGTGMSCVLRPRVCHAQKP